MARGPWRIRDRSTFDLLRHAGARARRGPVGVVYARDQGERPRVAFGIGRRVGNAVTRNRLRRVLRDELATIDLPAGAYLVTVMPDAADATSSAIREHLRAAIDAATRRAR